MLKVWWGSGSGEADEDRVLLRASAFAARRSIGALLREDPAENNLGLPD